MSSDARLATPTDAGSGEPAADVLDRPEAGGAAIRGSGLRSAGYAAGVALGLASAPLLLRHLGVVDFGRYTLVLSLIALVGGVTEGGLTAVALREYAVREGAERDAVMRNLLGLRLALTAVGVAIAMGFALLAGYDSTLVAGTFLAGLGLLVISIHNLVAVSLAAKLRFGWLTGAELARQVATVALIVALVVAGASLIWFLGVMLVAGLVGLALIVVLIRGMVPLRPAFEPRKWWPLLKDVLPYSAAVAVNVTYFRITIVLMSLIATGVETGYFAASFRILEVLIALPWLIVSAVFPILSRAARDNRERFDYVVRRTFEVSLMLGVWMALCLVLGAQFVIDVIAGEEFQPSVAVLRIQALAIVGTFVATACGFALLSLRRHLALLVPNLLALVLTVVLTLVLVPIYAERGAAVATVAAEAVLAVSITVLLVRFRPDLKLPFGAVPAVALAAAVGASTALVPGLHDVLRVAIASVAYFGLLGLMGRIPPELRDALVERRTLAKGSA